jgi:hypothetical protein
MAFVPHSKHDVFVSYAVVDNGQPLGKSHGWVTAFVDQLELELARCLGRKDCFDLWLDRKRLSCNDVFSSEIEDELHRSAVLITLYSQGYLVSPWCEREREIFLESIRDRIDSDKRLFLVEIDKVENDPRPDALKRINYFRLWGENTDGQPLRFGSPVPNPSWESHQLFYNGMSAVGRQVASQLRRLAELEQESQDANQVSSVAGNLPIVFLAEATDDVMDIRSEVAAYLGQFHIRTVPTDPLPADLEAAQAAINRYYDQAVVFAQILGKSPGERPKGSLDTYASLQWQLVRSGKKSRLQWRSPKLDLANVRDADHLNLLKGDFVRVEELELFKKAIVEEVDRVTKSKDPGEKRGRKTDEGDEAHAPQMVFVSYDQEDGKLGTQVCAMLGKRGFVCMEPLFYKSKQEDVLKDYEANLDECNGLVLIYGQVPVVWVREQFRNVIKRLATRPRRLRPWWVVDGPPAIKDDVSIGIKCPGLSIVDCRSGDLEGILTPVLAQLEEETFL